jgi:hypothetical protein
VATLGPLFFFDNAERDVVQAALDVIERTDPEEASLLVDGLDRLAQAADLVQKSPLLGSWETRRVSQNGESLVELLCAVPEWDLDLHVPVRVVFGQSYLVAKINFFKGIKYGLERVEAPDALQERVEFELGQSIYSKLAEELFLSIVTDARGQRRVKVAAARALFRIWQDRLQAEIDDFAPVLESVWRARNKVRPVIGTTLGTHEFFRLLGECSDTRFLEYFEDDVPEEQVQAFEEFLFGLSWEQLSALRERMEAERTSVVSREEAEAYVQHPESWAPYADGPQALYTSYKKRRVKAQYRVLTESPGPHKTAEEFVMTSFLMRETSSLAP